MHSSVLRVHRLRIKRGLLGHGLPIQNHGGHIRLLLTDRHPLRHLPQQPLRDQGVLDQHGHQLVFTKFLHILGLRGN